MGNLMATTAQVARSRARSSRRRCETSGAQADRAPGVRPALQPRDLGRPAVSVAKQIPVRCADVMSPRATTSSGPRRCRGGAQAAAEKVIALLKDYDARESKMIEIIKREKSMLKALEIYGRY